MNQLKYLKEIIMAKNPDMKADKKMIDKAIMKSEKKDAKQDKAMIKKAIAKKK